MFIIKGRMTALLAAGLLIAATPTLAQEADASVDLGLGNAQADGDISLSGSADGTNTDADLALGRSSDTSNADANVTIGDGSDSSASISIGSSDDAEADATASIGGSEDVEADVRLGLGGAGVGASGSLTPSAPTSAAARQAAAAISSKSESEIARYKKRCDDISGNSANYDATLVELCQIIQSASR